MKLKFILLAVVFAHVVTLAITYVGRAAGTPAAPKVPQGWKFTFPDGDSKTGQAVFMNMQCYSCHRIKIPGEELPADAGGIGPDLTG